MINNYNDNLNYNRPYYSSQYKQYTFVNGIEGAKSFQMPPNQSMLLMDADNPICYMKTSDPMGKCSLRYFQLTEMDENAARNLLQPNNQESIYASKEDIDAINKKLDDIYKKLDAKNNSRKDINA